MVTIYTRAQIGLRPRNGGGTSLPLTASNVAYHWPGSAKAIDARGDAGFRRVCSALRGWQAYHMDGRGWSDIAYQMAVDNEGRIYTLRGINIQSGANGDGPTNRKYGAILLVLGPGEQMSEKMKASCRALGAMYRKRFSRMPRRPTWHGAVRPGGTSCPGPEAISEIRAGSLDAGTTPPLEDEDMPWTETQLRAMMQAEEEEYAVRFWVAPTGTGTALLALVREMKLQLDRIENDTDQIQAGRALVADLDANVATLKSRPAQAALADVLGQGTSS